MSVHLPVLAVTSPPWGAHTRARRGAGERRRGATAGLRVGCRSASRLGPTPVTAGRRPSPPGAQLQLVVTGFRLRSTTSSVWFGAMAGADKLDVAEGRFERVVQTTAERIVAGL